MEQVVVVVPRPAVPIEFDSPFADFATGLRSLKTASGLSFRQMSRKISVSPSVLSEASRGRRLPSWKVTRLYVEACDGSIQEWRRRWTEANRRGDEIQRPAGQYIGAATSPLDLQVHRAIETGSSSGDRLHHDVLPVYIERDHDRLLEETIARVRTGSGSTLITLVGGAATGKTRACWEALQRLPDGWRVWHPLEPDRPRAVLRELEQVQPRTVLWLDEAQHYLMPTRDQIGENVAASLRELLRDDAAQPVIVFATMRPHGWEELTRPPARLDEDSHSQARALLTGTELRVPDRFTAHQLQALHARADQDERLALALESARQGEITQYLASGPDLAARYEMAPPASRALLDAAIDARCLGHDAALPLALLRDAAPEYLTDMQRAGLDDDWLAKALDSLTAPSHGTPGPLARIRPTSGENEDQPFYRLADYLETLGRRRWRSHPIPHALQNALDGVEGSYWAEYERLEPIGWGPSATVYRAKRRDSGTLFALKIWRTPFGDARRSQFLEQVQSQRRLAAQDERIVPVFAAEAPPDRPAWAVTPLYAASLADRFQPAALPADAVVKMAREMLSALETLHRKGQIHGDIKPENCLVDRHNSVHLDLADLETMDASGKWLIQMKRTSHHTFITPETYTAPEVRSGIRTVASDVFSVGVVLSNVFGADIPSAVADLLTRAKSPQPADRPADAGVFRRALAAASRPQVVTVPITGTASVTHGLCMWRLEPGESLTFGRAPNCEIRFANDPEDTLVARHTGTLEAIGDFILVRNTSPTTYLIIRPFVGEEILIHPGMAVASLPHRRFQIVIPGRYGSKYFLTVDANNIGSSSDSPPADHPLTIKISPSTHRILTALCAPLLTKSGPSAVPPSYHEMGERLQLSPRSVRNSLSELRMRLGDAGIPPFDDEPDGRSAFGYQLALARWAIMAGHVTLDHVATLAADH